MIFSSKVSQNLKYLTNMRTVEDKSFEFVLTIADGKTVEDYADVKYGPEGNPRPVAELLARQANDPYIDKKTLTLEELKAAGWQKEAIFTQFEFSRAGPTPYVFKITETANTDSDKEDWTYDKAEWQVTVKVTERTSTVEPAAATKSPMLTATGTKQKIVDSDGAAVRAVANGWQYLWEELPKADEEGVDYTYTVREASVPANYRSSVSREVQIRVADAGGESVEVTGFRNTNTHEPPTVARTVTKIWNDAGDLDGLPPDETMLINEYDTPLGLATEEELEGLVEIGDYDTPLWGGLLQTGDDLPAYPFVSGGIGVLALVVLDRKKRKKEQ